MTDWFVVAVFLFAAVTLQMFIVTVTRISGRHPPYRPRHRRYRHRHRRR